MRCLQIAWLVEGIKGTERDRLREKKRDRHRDRYKERERETKWGDALPHVHTYTGKLDAKYEVYRPISKHILREPHFSIICIV